MNRTLRVLMLVGGLLSANSVDGQTPRFHPQTIDADVKIGYGLAIGRVDSDEWPDVILADQSEIVWYQNPRQQNAAWPRHVMARNLTERDNVCVAARDITGDGLVEVAVGAQWNPGETHDPDQSGAVFYLQRPQDPESRWLPHVMSPHPTTVHRMHWVQAATTGDTPTFQLVVLPLHGPGNQGGQGTPVSLHAFALELTEQGEVAGHTHATHATNMHMTHNFEIAPTGFRAPPTEEVLIVAGLEGLTTIGRIGKATEHALMVPAIADRGAGEVRVASVTKPHADLVAIEPMHGTEVVLYHRDKSQSTWQRQVLESGLNQGHALAAADLLGLGSDQIVAGWRNPDAENRVGIKLYVPGHGQDAATDWQIHVIDNNRMACEDLRVVDLDQDGKLDIVASGRATNNLIIYWNQN